MPMVHLLATDLDGTLVGNRTGLKKLLAYLDSKPYEVKLVYVTGRHLHSALTLISKEQLPHPDALITDIGTSIYTGAALIMDESWDLQMKLHWKPEKIKKIAGTCEGLIPQLLPDDRRLSYVVSSDAPVKEFQIKLKEADISHKFVFSANRYIDILPKKSGKGNALKYVLKQYFSDQVRVLIAGDTGNDEDMLALGHPAVIVGNGHSELYRLEEYPFIYRAEQHYAGGIQEAWEYFYASENLAANSEVEQ